MSPVRPGAHAFADESRRRDAYYVAVAVLGPDEVEVARKVMRGFLMHNQYEIHFSKEKESRRREVLSGLAQLGASTTIYRATVQGSEEEARQQCLRHLAEDLLADRAGRLVLDTREGIRDRDDERTLRSVFGWGVSPVRYDHVVSSTEPLLWVADAVAWSHGAGGNWRKRAEPLVRRVVDAG